LHFTQYASGIESLLSSGQAAAKDRMP